MALNIQICSWEGIELYEQVPTYMLFLLEMMILKFQGKKLFRMRSLYKGNLLDFGYRDIFMKNSCIDIFPSKVNQIFAQGF